MKNANATALENVNDEEEVFVASAAAVAMSDSPLKEVDVPTTMPIKGASMSVPVAVAVKKGAADSSPPSKASMGSTTAGSGNESAGNMPSTAASSRRASDASAISSSGAVPSSSSTEVPGNRFQTRRSVELRQFDGTTVSPTQVARFRKLIRFAKEKQRGGGVRKR